MPGQIPNTLSFSSLLYIYCICVYIHIKERRPIKNISDKILSDTVVPLPNMNAEQVEMSN
jgi:hypothetical protein